jgi:hypothetical protein
VGPEVRRYRFNPLEQRGLIAGLQSVQLGVVAVAGLLAVAALRSAPNGGGVVAAAGVLVAAAAIAFWRVAGSTPAEWAPVLAEWGWRRLRGPRLNDAPMRGRVAVAPLEAAAAPALAGIQLLEAPAAPGEEPLAVVRDGRLRSYAAVLRVRGRSFSLLEPAEKERRLAQWGGALSGVARERSPVVRLQWVERSVPGDSNALTRFVNDAAVGTDASIRASYAELIAGAGPVTQAHEALLVVAVRAARGSTAVRAFGGGIAGACGLLRRELRLIAGQLRSAEIAVDGALNGPDLARCLRAACDPTRAFAGATSPANAWPMAGADGWSSYRSDGAWHVTYWVAEWPRLEVGPDFLAPLLLSSGGARTIAVTLGPVGTAQAVREVEAAHTAEVADERLRQRAGFLTTARRQRQAEGVLRREAELAEGHAAYRFSGYVTVTAADPEELDRSCAEVEQTAQQSYLELRRLYGRQAEAFTWTLPLGRGLR